MTGYRPTHTDRLTARIRANGWHPPGTFGCGCHPHHLCAAHATLRAAEHYHPELIPQ